MQPTPHYRLARGNLNLAAGMIAHTSRAFSVGSDEGAQRAWGELVSGNYFSVLGIRPLPGRVFEPEEYGDEPDGYCVAVFFHDLSSNRRAAWRAVLRTWSHRGRSGGQPKRRFNPAAMPSQSRHKPIRGVQVSRKRGQFSSTDFVQ